MRFRPDNSESESIQTLERIFLGYGDIPPAMASDFNEYRIERVTPLGHGTARLMLAGITSLDQAATLKGKNVFADARDLPAPEEHQFYYYEAVGCEVLLTDGTRLGIIEEVFPTGANDVFVVRDGAKEVLVPVIASIVKDIDLEGRRVTIEAVPGLLA